MSLSTDAPVAAERTWDLEALLDNRRWIRREDPFPFITATNVFRPDFYAELDAEYRRLEHEHPEAFQRNMPGYDASGASLNNYQDGPLGIFLSRPWHDLLASVTGVPCNGDVSGSVHHHDVGGKSGWPHNDFNPGWFHGDPVTDPNEVRGADTYGVNYRTGERAAGVSAHKSVRAVSLLFYLGNPDWEPGDGGETGLFRNLETARRGPWAAVPPINNSLVMFECTPYSFHAFVSNINKPRNSVVMWTHRDYADAAAQWGEHSVVDWP